MSSNQTDHFRTVAILPLLEVRLRTARFSQGASLMDDEWYYEHGDNRGGPCSGRQLRELADSGKIVPKDTIWKEGVEGGVLAGKVKNLFPKADAAFSLAVSDPVPSAKAPFLTPPAV